MHRTNRSRHRFARWTALVGLAALAAVPTLSDSASAAVPAPTITGIPTTAVATTGGTYLWIQGTGFTTDTKVTIDNNVPATVVRVVDSTQMTVIAPAHNLGAALVTATNSGGSSPNISAAVITYSTPPGALGVGTVVQSATLSSATPPSLTVQAGGRPAQFIFVDGVPRALAGPVVTFAFPIHAPGPATVVGEDQYGLAATPTTVTYTAASTTTLTVPTIHGFGSSVTLPAGSWTPIYPMLLGTLWAGTTPVYPPVTLPAPAVSGPVNLAYTPPATFGASTNGTESVQFVNTATNGFLQINFTVGNSSDTATGTFTPELGIGPCLLVDSGSAVQFGNVTVGAAAPTLGDVPTVVRSCSAAAENVTAKPSVATSPATNATYTVKSTTTPGVNELAYAITGTSPRALLDSTLPGSVTVASLTAAGTPTGGDTASLRHDVQIGAGSTATGSSFSVAITLTAILA